MGRHLAAALQKRGDSVRVLALRDEDTSRLEQQGIEVHRGDVRDPKSLVAPTEGVDRLVHLAALMGVWRPMEDYRAINVTGTENVCRAALAAGVGRLVHLSSTSVYGFSLGRTTDESFPLTPFRAPYTLTKAEADSLVQRMIVEDGLPAVIVRPDQIVGPEGLHFSETAARLRRGKGVIIGSGRNYLPLVYVSDVVQGLLLALDVERALGQAYNITNDVPLTQQEFLGEVAREIGVKTPTLHAPYRLLYAAAGAAERLAALTRSTHPPLTRLGVAFFGTDHRHSIDKARRELGYEPGVPLREGVRMAAEATRARIDSASERNPQSLVPANIRDERA